MRIEELKPGMIVRQQYTSYDLLEVDGERLPQGSQVVYRVPKELDFHNRQEGYAYRRRNLRTPILDVMVITPIEHADGTVSSKIEPHPKVTQRAVPGRDLRLVANTVGDAMLYFARQRERVREQERERVDHSNRILKIYEAVERITGIASHDLEWYRKRHEGDRDYMLYSLSLSIGDIEALLACIEELSEKAAIYDAMRED